MTHEACLNTLTSANAASHVDFSPSRGNYSFAGRVALGTIVNFKHFAS